MFLLGTIVNGVGILIGSLLGLLLPKVPPRFHETIMQGISLTVILIGLSMALSDSADILIIIISMALGGLLGTWLNIEGWLERMGEVAQKRLSRFGTSPMTEGFVTASLVFVVGSMAIVGAIQDGLNGVHKTLFAKTLLDFVTSTVLASTLGFGVLLSCIPVVIYEGLIAIIAHVFGAHLQNPAVIACMTASGGLLITGIGINILGLKKIAVGNLLPSMFIAAILKWMAPMIAVWFSFVK